MAPPALRDHALAAALVAALGAASLAHAFGPLAAETDEPYWLAAGQLTRELIATAAPLARWETAFDERGLSTFGNMNPPLGKLLVGLAPSLAAARCELALIAALCLGIAYLLARRLAGLSLAAVAAPALLFLVPIFQFSATHVYVDLPCILLCGASLLVLARWQASGSRLALAASLVLAGLACATKLNAGAFAASLGVYLVLVHRGGLKERLGRLAAASLVPAATFLAVDPFLWPDPLGRLRWMLAEWSRSSALQQARPDLASLAVTSRAEGLARVFSRAVLDPLERGEIVGWGSEWLEQNLAILLGLATLALLASLACWRLRLVPDRRRWIVALSVLGVGLLCSQLAPRFVGVAGALDVLGLGALIARARSEGRSSPAALLLTVFAISLGATGLWLPFDWARYYLPSLVWSPLLGAAGIGWLGSLFALERRRASAVSSPS